MAGIVGLLVALVACGRMEEQEHLSLRSDPGDLSATLKPDGVEVNVSAARMRLDLQGWGRGDAVQTPGPGKVACTACDDQAEISRSGLVEWWRRRDDGLEQGFTVTQPPAGDGPLWLDLQVDGARVELTSRRSARLVAPWGDAVRYEGLAAWDAREQALPAWIERTADGLRLLVDDRGAVAPITIDPVLLRSNWAWWSGAADARSGEAIASAGDVNGDGFGDVVIGAPGFQVDGSGATDGRVSLFFGSALGLSTTPAWTRTAPEGAGSGARFGAALASGDLNGDGWSDVIVGAPAYGAGGAVFVYLGSPEGLGTSPSWTSPPAPPQSALGASVASPGDLHGDGYGDLVIGAPGYSGGAVGEGQALVFAGSAVGPLAQAAWTVTGGSAAAGLGTSVAGAGDVNGDGLADLVVGAPGVDSALVYMGAAGALSTTPARALVGDAATDFGRSVGTAGDVNADGYADIAVGAPRAGASDEGEVRVHLGDGAGVQGSPGWSWRGSTALGHVGESVATAGDVNGDGYADLVVGAPFDGTGTAEGRGRVFLGWRGGLGASPSRTWTGDQADSGFGLAVAGGGDVNGDGFGDVLVAAPVQDRTQNDEGAVYLFPGVGADVAVDAAWSVTGDEADSSASAASVVGDVNGDGYGDVMVGAAYNNRGLPGSGLARLYYGGASGVSDQVAWSFIGATVNAHLGMALSPAGDVNGDGYDDVIIGAPGHDGGDNGEGMAVVFHGSPDGLGGVPNWTVEGNLALASLGASLAAGDVNGDGFSDVIIGAPGYARGQVGEGRALVYLGSASGLATTPAWAVEPDVPDAGFGSAVGCAGDVNGDGFEEVLVGATMASSAGVYPGRASLYLGSPAGPSGVAAWTTQGTLAEYVGRAVSTAGDVNGDGFDDVVIGMRGISDDGEALLYLGSALGLEHMPSWSVVGVGFSSGLGSSVAAGDLNNDGFSDVVLGGWTDARAWVHLGSVDGLSARPDTILEHYYDWRSPLVVGRLGDVNADGFADVVVAQATPAQNSSMAFVHHGSGSDGLEQAVSSVVQARQPGQITPIADGGTSISPTSFDVSMRMRAWTGRAPVQLQVEVKPLGVPFDGQDLVASPFLNRVDGSLVALTVTGLEPVSAWHWRARLRISAAHAAVQGWGPWRRGGVASGWVVRTAAARWYADTDGDGYGDPGVVREGGRTDGYVLEAGDCDDQDSAVHPGVPERCDAADVDEDCDGRADDAEVEGATNAGRWYVDGDADGYGAGPAISRCDAAPGEVSFGDDCDDRSALIHPGAQERCDPADADEDCDGLADDEAIAAADPSAWYTDADADGFGAGPAVYRCDAFAGSAPRAGDCQDGDPEVHPEAVERCDAADMDEDCDGAADDRDVDGAIGVSTAYVDQDGDGWGAAEATLRCDLGLGVADNALDCDDGSAITNPGAAERCDLANRDEDCDGGADDDDFSATGVTLWYADGDSDGWGAGAGVPACDAPAGRVAFASDCDDADRLVSPGAAERCDVAGVDEDCDGRADDLDPDGALGQTTYHPDADGDGFGGEAVVQRCAPSAGYTTRAGDCDDASAQTSPTASERCDRDDHDEDCDGFADDRDPQGATGTSAWYADQDHDGAGAGGSTLACDAPAGFVAAGDDCDDRDARMHPAAIEICNSLDDDCRGGADDGLVYLDWRPDRDGDGFGAAGPTTRACAQPPGLVADGTDCDDGRAAAFPGAPEICDGRDEDCDGVADDGLATVTVYTDLDGDGFGDLTSGRPSCDPPAGAVLNGADCDDLARAVHPEAQERCDLADVDEDCDGAADDLDTDAAGRELYLIDSDGDGFGAELEVQRCDPEDDEVQVGGDCNDGNAEIYPSAPESCTQPGDWNCDGASGYQDKDGDGTAACEDCDDNDGARHPEATEVCNEVDDDCDGAVDLGAADVVTWSRDDDGDGYTLAADTVEACEAPLRYAAPSAAEDCDDADADAWPGATEVAGDGVDQDCDGEDANVVAEGCSCEQRGHPGLMGVAWLAWLARRRRERSHSPAPAQGRTPPAAM